MAVKQWAAGDLATAADMNAWTVPLFAYKTANESVTSSAALQNDDHLVLPVAANAVYQVQAYLRYEGATAGDLSCDFTLPASAALQLGVFGLHTTATTTTDVHVITAYNGTGLMAFGALGAGTDCSAFFNGTFTTAGTAGNLQFRWAQSVSSGTATIMKQYSYLKAVRVG